MLHLKAVQSGVEQCTMLLWLPKVGWMLIQIDIFKTQISVVFVDVEYFWSKRLICFEKNEDIVVNKYCSCSLSYLGDMRYSKKKVQPVIFPSKYYLVALEDDRKDTLSPVVPLFTLKSTFHSYKRPRSPSFGFSFWYFYHLGRTKATSLKNYTSSRQGKEPLWRAGMVPWTFFKLFEPQCLSRSSWQDRCDYQIRALDAIPGILAVV